MIEYHNKITALYSRLSVGDEDRDGGESNSIVNQKAFLERYAREKKLINIRHYIDDDENRGTLAGDTEGIDVGLFLARNIIEGHGGYIKVKSKVGAGSTFGIYFPILSKVKD